MKVAVLIKSVPDTATVIRVDDGMTTIDTDDAEYVVNAYDEYALEEAIRLKEVSTAEVVAVSMGGAYARKALRSALAMGADRAILVEKPVSCRLADRAVSKVLAKAIETISPDIIFAGKQSVDCDGAQVPERVAEILGLPHVSAIVRFALDGRTAQVDREIEEGHYTVSVPLPALFTTQKGINTPRYPILPNILKAQRAKLEEVSINDLGICPDDLEPGIHINSLTSTSRERLGKIIGGDTRSSATELAGILMGKWEQYD